MDKLTNIIEAVLFASGKAVAITDIADKLGVTRAEVKKSLEELKSKYGEESGILLLEFNQKAQFGSNPVYKDAVSSVLNPIREKELTRTLLECAAIIAYKQPITRTEIELLRGVNSDYAVNALLDLKLIYPSGRKDAIGHPVLFSTTDEFLKRFKLNTLEDLPDYDELMSALQSQDDRDTYLYAREEYVEGMEDSERSAEETPLERAAAEHSDDEGDGELDTRGYDVPDFMRGIDESDLIKIS